VLAYSRVSRDDEPEFLQPAIIRQNAISVLLLGLSMGAEKNLPCVPASLAAGSGSTRSIFCSQKPCATNVI